MAFVALTLSLFTAAVGALGVVSPSRLLGFARRTQTPAGLSVAVAIRLIFGAALLFAAPASRAPQTVSTLGVVVLLAGLVTPFIGLARLRRILDRLSALGPGFLRAWGAGALLLGLLLAWAVAPQAAR